MHLLKNLLVISTLLTIALCSEEPIEIDDKPTENNSKLLVKRDSVSSLTSNTFRPGILSSLDDKQKSHVKREYESPPLNQFQTGFSPLYSTSLTPNYSPQYNSAQNYHPVQYSNLYSPTTSQPQYLGSQQQLLVAKPSSHPHHLYGTLQLSQVPPKLQYAGPQITYAPQSTSKLNYATPVAYPQVQLGYTQTPQHLPIQSHSQSQPQHQQQTHQPHSSPTTGPLAYQNSYAFVPMHAISLAFHQPALQNQGILTHTQAIPISPTPSHQTHYHSHSAPASSPIQYVYPSISTTAAKPALPNYQPAYTPQHYHQNPPLQQYAYAIQPSIQIASAKQVIPVTPTVPTIAYKHLPLTGTVAASTQQTQHSDHGATSYQTIHKHVNHSPAHIAPVLPTAVYHHHPHQPQLFTPIAQGSAQQAIYFNPASNHQFASHGDSTGHYHDGSSFTKFPTLQHGYTYNTQH